MMTISYRMLATIVGVVLLFGVGAAFVVDDDDASDSAATTVTSPIEDDDDGTDDEDDEDKDEDDDSTSTTRASTTSTTAGSATTATTAAGGATTSTTRRPGVTTTTRAPGTTAPPTTAPPTSAPTTAPPTTQPQDSADLLVHANISGDDAVRRVVLTVENAGPDGADALRLTASGAGAPVRSVQAGSGFNCSDNGSSVTCTSDSVGVGGRIRQVIIEFGVSPGCAGAPVLTASVSSASSDPNPGNNNLSPRSLCPAAGGS